MPKSRLLIIACSGRKISGAGPFPAWELYDGVIYRMLEKMERTTGLPDGLTIRIISAKYGLLMPTDSIPNYDLLMTEIRAIELKDDVMSGVRQVIDAVQPVEIFCCLGKHYRATLPDIGAKFSHGGIGTQMGQTKRWLEKLHKEDTD